MKWFDKLLPKSRAFDLSKNKQITEFFTALENVYFDLVDFLNDIYLDIWPSSTRQLDEWDAQFNLRDDPALTELQRRTRLDAAWKRTGGQSPKYIQDSLQNAGFDVYIHEWWEPGSNPPVARNPNLFVSTPYVPPQCGENIARCGEPDAQCTDLPFVPVPFDLPIGDDIYVVGAGNPVMEAGNPEAEAGNFQEPIDPGDGYLLVNKIWVTEFSGVAAQCGEPTMQCNETLAQCGIADLDYRFGRKQYPVPQDPDQWPYIIYICSEIYNVPATVEASRRDEFENLLLSICPAQQWLAIWVTYI